MTTSVAIQALRCLALDQIAAWNKVLDLVGGRPSSEEELAALRDSEASDYAAALNTERRTAELVSPAHIIRERAQAEAQLARIQAAVARTQDTESSDYWPGVQCQAEDRLGPCEVEG